MNLLTYTPYEQRPECDEALALVIDHQKFSLRRWFWRRVYLFTLKISEWENGLQWHAYVQSGEDIECAMMEETEFPAEYLTARGEKVRRWWENV